MSHEVEMTVSVLNINYVLRGFDAIRDLKVFLDEHASECWTMPVPRPDLGAPQAPPSSAP